MGRRINKSSKSETKSLPGVVIETVGRRVRVRDEHGERVCFLSGQRAVIGDQVRWVKAQNQGGKLVGVEPRRTALRRVDARGKEQVLAANLAGIVVVQSVMSPAFRAGLLDRYLVAAELGDLSILVIINKSDLGIQESVKAQLELRAPYMTLMETSVKSGQGIDELATFLAEHTSHGPWAFVGGSGVGKTSLIAALLPDQDVGAVGDVSEFWGTGRHTTTKSILLTLKNGGEIADSPGIRNFTPAGMTSESMRRFFPGVAGLRCHYRDCLHRENEEGCLAEDTVNPTLLSSYRRLLVDVLDLEKRAAP